jgi:hypothetical protein
MKSLFLCRNLLIFLCLIAWLTDQAQNAGVSVNSTGAMPAPSAMLDVSSSTAGMLVPRMTRLQRDQIMMPETSLLIFQTDNDPGYYYNAGTPQVPDWRKLVTTNEVTGGTGSGFTHYIGELTQGGIVVYVWKDALQAEHGLVASVNDLVGPMGIWVQWSNVTGNAGAWSNYDGQFNTTAIINQEGHTASAASLCDAYSHEGFDDWYLPSAFELNLVYQAGFVVNQVLGGYTDKLQGDPGYWSSTEYLNDEVIYQDFLAGPSSFPKSYFNCVRAVRKF